MDMLFPQLWVSGPASLFVWVLFLQIRVKGGSWKSDYANLIRRIFSVLFGVLAGTLLWAAYSAYSEHWPAVAAVSFAALGVVTYRDARFRMRHRHKKRADS
jgi:hypothetical protein